MFLWLPPLLLLLTQKMPLCELRKRSVQKTPFPGSGPGAALQSPFNPVSWSLCTVRSACSLWHDRPGGPLDCWYVVGLLGTLLVSEVPLTLSVLALIFSFFMRKAFLLLNHMVHTWSSLICRSCFLVLLLLVTLFILPLRCLMLYTFP